MKKIFTLLCVTLSSLAAMANGVEVNGIYYLLDSDNMTASVTYMGTIHNSGNNYAGDVVIPDTIVYEENKYAVTSISERAFYNCTDLEEVTIPNSIISIEDHAFDGCKDLTSITIPTSVMSIGFRAFSNNDQLASIEVIDNPIYDSRDNCNAIVETITNTLIVGCQNTIIPNSVTSIGNSAFYSCSNLTSITIPNSVTFIDQYAFIHCGLSSVFLGNSLLNIQGWSFGYCEKLTTITIPASVVYVDNFAFHGCYSLTSIAVATNNVIYDSREDCNAIIETITNTLIVGCQNTIIPNSITNIGNFAIEECIGLISITIPNSVTTIGEYAFGGCIGLTSVTIHNSVTTIGNNAFDGCRGLTSVTCLAIEPPSLGSSVFYSVPRTIPLYVPASSIPAYQAAAQWNEFDIQPLLVDVNPITPDTTQLSWLPVDSASLYKLRIYSEQIELDTTLMIEADSLHGGISIPVTLAPNRDRRMPMDDIGSVIIIIIEPRSGVTIETPFVVTVSTTSKDKIDVGFDLKVLKGEKTIKQESGGFVLNAPIPDGLEDIPFSNWDVSSGIYDLCGHRYSPNQWNTLPAGIYILRDGEKASKVMKQ